MFVLPHIAHLSKQFVQRLRPTQYAASIASYSIAHLGNNSDSARTEYQLKQIEKFYFGQNTDIHLHILGLRKIHDLVSAQEFCHIPQSLSDQLCAIAEERGLEFPTPVFSQLCTLLKSYGDPARIRDWTLQTFVKLENSKNVDVLAGLGDVLLHNVRRIHQDSTMSHRDVYSAIDIDGSDHESVLGIIEVSLYLGRTWLEDFRGATSESRDRALASILHQQQEEDDRCLLIPGMAQAIFGELQSQLRSFSNIEDALRLISYDPNMEILAHLIQGVVRKDYTYFQQLACIESIPNCLEQFPEMQLLGTRYRAVYFKGILRAIGGLSDEEKNAISQVLVDAHPSSSFFA